MRGPGTLAMLLPTIFATLFLFTVVVTLNKASSLTRGGNLVRIINVDDVFPAEDVEQHKNKEYFDAPPPPSPEAVLATREIAVPALTLEEPAAFPPLSQSPDATVPSLRATGRDFILDTPEIPMPVTAPDTSLPVAAPVP